MQCDSGILFLKFVFNVRFQRRTMCVRRVSTGFVNTERGKEKEVARQHKCDIKYLRGRYVCCNYGHKFPVDHDISATTNFAVRIQLLPIQLMKYLEVWV